MDDLADPPASARSTAFPPAWRLVLTIARRDLVAMCASMTAVGVTAAFLAISGLFFHDAVLSGREASLSLFMEPFNFLVVVVTPLLAARAFSEERRTGSAELLFTTPLGPGGIVVAKYLATLGVVLGMLSTTVAFPLVLERFGSPEWGPIAGQYLGSALLAASTTAVGIAASTLSPSQALTAVVGLVVSLSAWLLGRLTESVTTGVGSFLAALALPDHVSDLNRGLVDLSDLLFFVTFVITWLVVATQVARAELWRS